MSENAVRRLVRAFLSASRVIDCPLKTTSEAKISSITSSFCWFQTSSKKRRTIALFSSVDIRASFKARVGRAASYPARSDGALALAEEPGGPEGQERDQEHEPVEVLVGGR